MPRPCVDHDTTPGNKGGEYRTTDVDITRDPSSGSFYVGRTRVGEWLQYTVNVTETRSYTLTTSVANLGSGATFRVEEDGVDLTKPIPVPNTGGWETWQTLSVSGICLNQGQRVIRLVMVTRNVENNGVGNYNYVSFE